MPVSISRCGTLVVAFALLVGVAPCVSTARAQAARAPTAADPGSAWVKRDRVEWLFPAPELKGPGAPDASRGYWAWRVIIDERSDDSFVVLSSLATRSDGVAAIVRGSRIARCENAGVSSVLDCQRPISGRVTFDPSGIRITITEPAFVERIHRVRPSMFWIYTYLPGGRFVTYQIPFTYQVDPPSTRSQY